MEIQSIDVAYERFFKKLIKFILLDNCYAKQENFNIQLFSINQTFEF